MNVTINLNCESVLVPFYRGAVVFVSFQVAMNQFGCMFSSPFIEERLYFSLTHLFVEAHKKFSSPFIEERLYFDGRLCCIINNKKVLVPFYRGAVVFINSLVNKEK